jgi:hypothetical protein
MKATVIQKPLYSLTILVKPYNNSKVDKQTLGHHTWTLLHLMSLHYPENPTEMEQDKMVAFMHLL